MAYNQNFLLQLIGPVRTPGRNRDLFCKQRMATCGAGRYFVQVLNTAFGRAIVGDSNSHAAPLHPVPKAPWLMRDA